MSDRPSTHNPQPPEGGAPPEAPGVPDEAANVKRDDLAEALRKRDEYLDQLQRSRAEFANFQKRAKVQAESDRLYAVGSLARDLLEGLDNLERGAESLRTSAPAGVADGLAIVHKQLLAILAKHGVEPIEALGHPFDPNQHEALMQQPSAEQPEGTVVAELSKGYRIHDRVLRPSRVAVSVRPTGA